MNSTQAIKSAVKKNMKHPGFSAVQNKIESEEGVSKKSAGAILASATRKASSAAKRMNPKLKKVKGKGTGVSDSDYD